MRLSRILTAALSAAVLTVTTAEPASAAPGWLRLELRYAGDVLGSFVQDSSGNAVHGQILTGGGGTVTSVEESGRRFLRFPGGSCTAAPPCPQGIVRPVTSITLVPGDEGQGRFIYGADIRLTQPPSPDAGQNVFQFGAAAAGLSQWKLQVDYGRPSCRWSDGAQVVLLPAGPEGFQLTVGQWYRVTCSRKAHRLFEIRVEDPVTGGQVVPPQHRNVPMSSILPSGSVVIGGKRVNAAQTDVDTDQFHGDLDTIEFGRRAD